VVQSVKAVWQAMATGFQMDSASTRSTAGVARRHGLDAAHGLADLGAVTFGALLEEFGMIARLVDPLIHAARTTGRLFATVFACASASTWWPATSTSR
jgi:NhaC family Na+:H+ antiporter